jgi:serine/threonine-protein kinase
MLTGTPMYMAPEAIKGAQFVDGRSDLYALGAVGYFLVTGTPVFGAENVIEIVAHHLQTPPTPPSERIGHAVPADLEQVLMRCLAKDPGDRFPTARDLTQARDACTATSPWSLQRAAERWASLKVNQSRSLPRTAPSASLPTLAVDLHDRVDPLHETSR